jgi:hypothetical protein
MNALGLQLCSFPSLYLRSSFGGRFAKEIKPHRPATLQEQDLLGIRRRAISLEWNIVRRADVDPDLSHPGLWSYA